MLLLVLAVVRDHGAGGVGEGVVLLVRSIGETDTEEQQKDEFGSRVLVISTTSVMALPILWNSVTRFGSERFFKIPFCNNKVLI